MLIRKMVRDIWKNKVPFAAVFLMMFAGNFIFSGITSEYNGMSKNFHDYIKATKLADAWIDSDKFETMAVDRLEKKRNISAVEYRRLVPTTLEDDKNKTIALYILKDENKLSKITVISGKKYSNDIEGVWLDALFAKENDLRPKDKIKLDAHGQKIEKEIVGLCYSPEYIFNSKDGSLVPDHKHNGFAYIGSGGLGGHQSIEWNQLLISGKGDIKKAVYETIGRENIVVTLQKDHPSYSMLNDEIKQHKEIGLIFVTVFIFIALLITITTVHRLLNSQRLQIGILKALGFREAQLYGHYICHSTVICLAGSFLGWYIGNKTLPNLLHPIMSSMYTLPKALKAERLAFSWRLPLGCAVLCLLISAIICSRYLKDKAAKMFYANAADKKYKELKFPFLWKYLSFYSQWNSRDIFRNGLRSAMTIFGVVGCTALIFAALGLHSSMNHMAQWTFGKAQTYEIKLSGNFTDESYKRDLLKQIDGEELMEGMVELKAKGKEKNVSFTSIESHRYLHLYNKDGEKVNLRKGIAISRNTAKEMHIRVGDKVRWRFPRKDKWYSSFVEYIIVTPTSQGITILKNQLKSQDISYTATSLIGKDKRRLDIDDDYISNVQNKKSLQDGLSTMLDATVTLSMVFLVMAVLLGGVILYNLGSLSYMERYRDMATLKVLGLNNKCIKHLMAQQNLWLTIIGIALGIPAGYELIKVMIGTVQPSIDINIYTPSYVYGISALGTLGLSLAIGKRLTNRIGNIDMVAALKINE